MAEQPTPHDVRQAHKDHVVGLLEEEWGTLATLLQELDDAQWERRALPGWSVHDTVSHMVGTERALSGAPQPPAPPGVDDAAHVRNDIARGNEAWVVALRARSHAELLEDFRDVTAARLETLRAATAEEFEAPSWTPAGPGTYARFMEIRVFDCYMHEQDIRVAVGMPGHESGPAAEQSLHEVVGALGYIVGKRAGAPDGSRIHIQLTGPITAELYVAVVEGRAKVVDALDGPATATLALSSALFLRLAGGRQDPEAALSEIKLGGDDELARRLATHLAYTI
ncbi:MAG TPA: maleylpyruvate isomerase family mycothiol-dependent enzyme [Acidimicrobiales bacterium]|nr:maleylpyruvate isomerase family mycothiol-dependent enzyme [Acidimicrobiales bacterium]